MREDAKLSIVEEIMTGFAVRTGLSPPGKTPRRYLWTDAFAVCNFLELYHRTGNEKYKGLALLLVDQVHEILGRHREDDTRTGWISGLDEREGRAHPTAGGLRIGKKMNERRREERFNERLEWDRDGQYYHYLTKWMHALNCVSRVTGDPAFNRWAIELAKAAHAGFVYVPSSGGGKMMYWKMSMDCSYPLVSSMGHHDPLDGLITYEELQSTSLSLKDPEGHPPHPGLTAEIADMAGICEGTDWATPDPLGIGGLLSDAHRLGQMIVMGFSEQTDLLETLLDASLLGLESYAREDSLKLPADYRLGFRELGLSIGLKAAKRLRELIEKEPGRFKEQPELRSRGENLARRMPLVEKIENFWLDPANRGAAGWKEHLDINEVMLATSLAPDGYLRNRWRGCPRL